MEQNKGFWYADWSFPIFVGLLSSGVFAGTHMYYLYGIGAFNEVAFVAMLKAGIDTGAYGAVAAFGAQLPVRPHHRRVAGRDSGYRRRHTDRYRPRRAGAAARRGLCLPGGELRRVAGQPAWSSAWRSATSSFWRVSSPSTRAIPPTAPT